MYIYIYIYIYKYTGSAFLVNLTGRNKEFSSAKSAP